MCIDICADVYRHMHGHADRHACRHQCQHVCRVCTDVHIDVRIGTEHGPLDILLCACLGFPGLVYAMTATNERLWLRACVAVEFLMVGLASVLADGLLLKQSTGASNRDGLLFIDRKTSVVHVLTLLGMFIYRGVSGHASAAQLGIAVAIGVVSLATFHGRLYYTFVEQVLVMIFF